jgi:hypothetical protein
MLLGVLERLTYAQMVLRMPTGVLLMHTQLALMNLALFILLLLARNQGAGNGSLPESEVLQRPNACDLLSMAALDTMHSLLALEGATAISGIQQALLLQATIPATAILAMLLPASVASGLPTGSKESEGGFLPFLRHGISYMVNQLTPSECIAHVVTSHVTYRILSATLIAGTVFAALQSAWDPAAPDGVFIEWIDTPSSQASPLEGFGTRTPPAAAHTVSARADSSISLLSKDERLPAPTGRLVFVLAAVIAAFANVHKRRCLMRQPADQLLLNTCIAALQLLIGLFIGPPMLMLLRQQPIHESLLQLARGLRCCMSGFNAVICADASDAYGTPALLTFFIASTFWSAASFALLFAGGKTWLAVGSALLLPTTLLAFVRPVPLPFSWLAPPLSLSASDMAIAALLCVTLVIFHFASLTGMQGAKEQAGWRLGNASSPLSDHSGSSRSGGAITPRSRGARSVLDVDPAELVGPSLHL